MHRRTAVFLAILAISLGFGTLAATVQDYRLQDFECLRGAALLVRDGRDPYDQGTWATATGLPAADAASPRRTSCLGSRFAYPLWTAVLLLPFAFIPYPATAALWLALNIGAALSGALLALRAVDGGWRRAPLALALVVSSQPLVLTIQSGQIDGIETGLIGLAAWALARRRDRTAGLSLALALLKPQLLAATAPLLALRAPALRRPRPLGAFALGALALLLLSLVVRSSWLAPWLAETTGPRLGIAPLLPTIWGLAADLTGSAAWGLAPATLLVLLVVGLGRRLGTAEGLALATALSVALTPHAWSYDHLVLAPAWVMLVGRAAGGRLLQTQLVVVGLASVMPWALYALALSRGTETLGALVPIATTVALAVLARPVAQAPHEAGR